MLHSDGSKDYLEKNNNQERHKMENTYTEAKKFWNQAFEMNEEDLKDYIKEIKPEDGWKELASSEKLADVLVNELAGKNQVLDYGCGEGWGGIILSKSGCKNVTCVDVVENAIGLVEKLRSVFKIETGFQARCVSDDWLKDESGQFYDGIFCSNVIDVLPEYVANDIIENFARITTDDAKLVIAMNHYSEPVSVPDKNVEAKNGNEIYVNGILRMVARTDEEWSEIFSKYFEIEKIEHFAWPGETEEKRRIFVLRKKN